MKIENDDQLKVAIDKAGELLQSIQNYVERDFTKPAKVRFPRGYIRSATTARNAIPFIKNNQLKSNLSYVMMLSDVQHWLLARTDLAGTAKEMVIKLQFFLFGTLVESITKDYLKGICGGNYAKRVDYLESNSIINKALAVEIKWLWNMRNKMHIFQVDQHEWLSTDYTVANHNRAVACLKSLLQALKNSP